ncbi:MAG: 5,10-methylenetetrahydrofolate reductase [candidate division WS1 bacterium]|nr:5,10-methylenetetrahydrofolate reductase [candidate division WS1 bacterium]
MAIRDALAAGKFVVTTEVAPPKGCHLDHMIEAEAEPLRGRVDGYNVTDLQSAAMRASSFAGCLKLKQAGLDPVMQMVCRDRNRLSLQSELLSAAAFGITEVLCLTGDYTTLGDHPDAMPVFDLDSVQLLATARGLREGHDLAGNELEGDPPDLLLGCVVNPGAVPLEPQIMKLRKKVAAGAQFVQTQAVYDPEKFAEFMRQVEGLGVPIFAGIVMLKSAGMAKYMNNNVAGVTVPDEMIERMKKAEDKVATSIEITVELVKGLQPLCQGLHFMPLGWNKHQATVLDEVGL